MQLRTHSALKFENHQSWQFEELRETVTSQLQYFRLLGCGWKKIEREMENIPFPSNHIMVCLYGKLGHFTRVHKTQTDYGKICSCFTKKHSPKWFLRETELDEPTFYAFHKGAVRTRDGNNCLKTNYKCVPEDRDNIPCFPYIKESLELTLLCVGGPQFYFRLVQISCTPHILSGTDL